MKKLITKILILFTVVFNLNITTAQDYGNLQNALSGYSYRSVGPAFMSGRIADIAIDSNIKTTCSLQCYALGCSR